MQVQNFNEPLHPLLQRRQRTDTSEYALQLYALPEDLEYVNQYTPLENLRLKNMYQPNPMRYFAPSKSGENDVYHHVPPFEFSEILEFQQNKTAAITETTIKALGLLTQSRITYKQQLDRLHRMSQKPKLTEPRLMQQNFPSYEDASKRLLAETSNDLQQPRLQQIADQPAVQQAVVPGQAQTKSTIKAFSDQDVITTNKATDVMMLFFKQQAEEYKAAQKQQQFMYQQQPIPYQNQQQPPINQQNIYPQQFQQQPQQIPHNALVEQLANRFKEDNIQLQQPFDPQQPIVPGIYLTTQPHRPPTHQQDISQLNTNVYPQNISQPPNYQQQRHQESRVEMQTQQQNQLPIYSSNVYNTFPQQQNQQQFQQVSQQTNQVQQTLYQQSKPNQQLQPAPVQIQLQQQQVIPANQVIEPDVEIDLNNEVGQPDAQFEPIQVELEESVVEPKTDVQRPKSASAPKQSQSQAQAIQGNNNIPRKSSPDENKIRGSDPTISSAISMISSGINGNQSQQSQQKQVKAVIKQPLPVNYSDDSVNSQNSVQKRHKPAPIPELVHTDSGSAEFSVGNAPKKPQEYNVSPEGKAQYNQQKPPINVAPVRRDQTIQDILRQLSDEEDEDDSFDINKDATKKPSPQRKKQKKKIATTMQKSMGSEISESFLSKIGKKPQKTKQAPQLTMSDNDLFSD